MFDKFGEFDSWEELNRAAAAQLEEGDEEAIFLLAKENGIDKEDARDYMDGFTPEFVTPLMAALGKIAVEDEDLKLDGVFLDWKDVILQCCTEDEEFCLAVRRKGKSLEDCMGRLLKTSFETKKRVNERICKAAGLNPNIYMGLPNRAEVKKLIKKYYLGGDEA